eukprot:m.14920 g.14920  ORF g.14920 m.14920 type:complete len:838 (-) comp2985_c0_seq2:139-2652(-)
MDPRRKKKEAAPFYAPADHASAIHERIVGETRAAVRALQTSRPFTPMDRGRGLFGASTVADSMDSRPTSAITIGRKQFLASLPDSQQPSRPPTGRMQPLPPLQPPTAAHPRSRSLSHQASSNSMAGDSAATDASMSRERSFSQAGEDVFDSAPATPPRQRVLPRPPAQPRAAAAPVSGADDSDAESDLPTEKTESPARAGKTVSAPLRPLSSEVPASPRQLPVPPPTAQSHIRRSTSADKQRVSTAEIADEAAWETFMKLLTELTPESVDYEAMYGVCTRMCAHLARHPIHGGRRKGMVLRSLFRMLDLKDARLLMKIARVVLMIVKTGPTLANLCKLLFKLTRDSSNDAIFFEEGMPNLLVTIVEQADRAENADALIYTCGAIKNTSAEESGQNVYVARGAVQAFSSLLFDVVANVRGSEASAGVSHMLVQLTAALRNMASQREHKLRFNDSHIVESLAGLLSQHAQHEPLVHNIIRIFSALTSTPECCPSVASDTRIFGLLVDIINAYRSSNSLVLRALYVLGNLTADNDDSRSVLFSHCQNGAWLFGLLADFIARDEAAARAPPPRDERAPSPSASGLRETADLLVKLMRVIANLCIHPDVGQSIASTAGVERIVGLLRKQAKELVEEPLINTIGAINNISYYAGPGNLLWEQRIEIAELLIPLLCESMDVVIESARVFGNFSQEPEIRQLLLTKRVDELLVLLVANENPEIVWTACGILMNLAADPASRHALQHENSMQLMIDALDKAGLATQDWQLAGMACKTLWNFFDDPSNMDDPACDALMDLLAELLDDATAAELDEDSAEERQAEFVPVATPLLRRLQRHRSELEPLS